MSTLKTRIVVAALSAAGIGAIATHEGFREKAYVPVPGDSITIAYGSTRYEDGSPVKMGDTVTKERGMQLFKNTLSIYEQAVQKCAPFPMHQYEYDAYVSFTYNLGGGTFCKSIIPKKLAAGEYEAACKEILRYNKFKNPATGQYIVLKGLDNRRKEEYKTCMGAGVNE